MAVAAESATTDTWAYHLVGGLPIVPPLPPAAAGADKNLHSVDIFETNKQR